MAGPLELETFFVLSPAGTITTIAGADAIAPPPANPRITCHHCRTLLEYPEGSSYVQCFVCSAMNAVVATSAPETTDGGDTTYPTGGRTINMLCAVCGTSNLGRALFDPGRWRIGGTRWWIRAFWIREFFMVVLVSFSFVGGGGTVLAMSW